MTPVSANAPVVLLRTQMDTQAVQMAQLLQGLPPVAPPQPVQPSAGTSTSERRYL